MNVKWMQVLRSMIITAVTGGMAALVLMPSPAFAAAPSLVNTGTWLETLSVSKDTTGERLRVTVLVKHDAGVNLTGLAVDDDWDSTDETLTVTPKSVTPQSPTGDFNYSRATLSWSPPNPPGFACGVFSATRRVDNTLRLRAVTSDGQRTGVVSASVHAVENNQCTGHNDFGFLFDQSQDKTSVVPGESVVFSFRGDDVDSDESWDGYRYRTRRLNDNSTTGTTSVTFGSCDNCTKTLSLSFSQRGRYVVEAEVRSDASYQDSGRFFWIGAVDVNTAATNSPTLTLNAPDEVNVGDTFNINAITSDSADLNGRVQMIEWDANGDAVFERREFASSESTGLTAAQLTQTIDTTGMSNGAKVFRARVTDNGAMNGADPIRRTKTVTVSVYLNGIPTVTGGSLLINEGTSVPITLQGSDPDGHGLTYEIVSGPLNGSLSTIEGDQVTYAPVPGFFGADSFEFRASDGHGGVSALASVNIEVNAVPVAEDASVTTDEDVALGIPLIASDRDGDEITYVVEAPSHGTLSGEAPNLLYTPDPNWFGNDSFTFQVTDPRGGASDIATVSIEIGTVNDAPTTSDLDVITMEDTAGGIILPGADVDGDPLTFTITSAPQNGSLQNGAVTGTSYAVTYQPNPDFSGSDSFAFEVSDGKGGVATGVVSITVTEAPVIHTQLAAHPFLGSGTLSLPHLRATLSQLGSGAPVVGKTIRFYVGGDEVCTAMTGSDGLATCSSTEAYLRAASAGGFSASFAGDPDHFGSSGTTGVIAL